MNVGWDGRGDLALNTGPLSLPLTRESWSHLKWRAGREAAEGKEPRPGRWLLSPGLSGSWARSTTFRPRVSGL